MSSALVAFIFKQDVSIRFIPAEKYEIPCFDAVATGAVALV
jgi:hypothetical protein